MRAQGIRVSQDVNRASTEPLPVHCLQTLASHRDGRRRHQVVTDSAELGCRSEVGDSECNGHASRGARSRGGSVRPTTVYSSRGGSSGSATSSSTGCGSTRLQLARHSMATERPVGDLGESRSTKLVPLSDSACDGATEMGKRRGPKSSMAYHTEPLPVIAGILDDDDKHIGSSSDLPQLASEIFKDMNFPRGRIRPAGKRSRGHRLPAVETPEPEPDAESVDEDSGPATSHPAASHAAVPQVAPELPARPLVPRPGFRSTCFPGQEERPSPTAAEGMAAMRIAPPPPREAWGQGPEQPKLPPPANRAPRPCPRGLFARSNDGGGGGLP